MYCLWPLPRVLLVCTTVVYVLFVATPTCNCSMCTVCGHPTMSNYSFACTTINSRSSSSSLPAITATSYYSYKIVGVGEVAVLAFRITATSYYLSEVHVYCLWPLPLLFVYTTSLLFVYTTYILIVYTK